MVEPNETSFDPGEEENDDLPLVLIPYHGQNVLKLVTRTLPHAQVCCSVRGSEKPEMISRVRFYTVFRERCGKFEAILLSHRQIVSEFDLEIIN